MKYIITYKSIRHWYARINNAWDVEITIPTRLKGNEEFKGSLLKKAEQLHTRYHKKTHLQTQGKDFVLLFWESVPIQEIAPNPKKITSTLKKILQEYTEPIIQKYSDLIWKKYASLHIRKTRSKRWSCTSDQKISLNLDLVHLPTKYITYVVIHEVCHLKIKNHSPSFRKLVENYSPNYKVLRKELKQFIIK